MTSGHMPDRSLRMQYLTGVPDDLWHRPPRPLSPGYGEVGMSLRVLTMAELRLEVLVEPEEDRLVGG